MKSAGFDPWLQPNRPLDKNNIQPRLGFAYSFNDRTVMRGGWGLFYGGGTGAAHAYYTETQIINVQVNNDGRPDFASNPFNGPIPTYEQVVSSGALRSLFLTLPSDHAVIPFAHQASVGLQRQFGSNMSVAADLVFSDERSVLTQMDINLAYDPVTGANYPFNDQTRRPNPGWGNVNMSQHVPKGGEDIGAAARAEQAHVEQLAGVGGLLARGRMGLPVPAGADRGWLSSTPSRTRRRVFSPATHRSHCIRSCSTSASDPPTRCTG